MRIIAKIYVTLQRFYRKNMKRFIFAIFFLLLNAMVFGQIQVRYDKEAVIDSVDQAYQNAWKTVKYCDGYRIQLVAVSNKSGAQKVYNDFKAAFPEANAYLSYTEPTFRVRVGNFKNRIDAYRFLMKIQGQFPGAFITRDKISFREI